MRPSRRQDHRRDQSLTLAYFAHRSGRKGCKVATQASRFEQGARVAERLDCTDASPAGDGASLAGDVSACLRARGAFDFVGQVAFEGVGWIGTDPARMWEMFHGPNIDGHVFVEDASITLREGRHAKVPLVVGSNKPSSLPGWTNNVPIRPRAACVVADDHDARRDWSGARGAE